MKFRVDEISSVLREEISQYQATIDVAEVGRVLEVGDGIARVYGVSNVMAGEMVEFADGSVIAQMGVPDMRTPIQYAVTYPRRLPCPSPSLDLAEVGRLRFERPDPERFPALKLGYEAAREGGVAGAILNAANESAVELFRAGEIRFTEIVELVARVME